jgi:hypothetical protein
MFLQIFLQEHYCWRLQTLLNKVPNAQKSDAETSSGTGSTEADSSNTACHQKTIT